MYPREILLDEFKGLDMDAALRMMRRYLCFYESSELEAQELAPPSEDISLERFIRG